MKLLIRWIYLLFSTFGVITFILLIAHQVSLFNADTMSRLMTEMFFLFFFNSFFIAYFGNVKFKHKIYFYITTQVIFVILYIIMRVVFSLNYYGAINFQTIISSTLAVVFLSLVFLIIMFFVLSAEVQQINEKLKQMKDK